MAVAGRLVSDCRCVSHLDRCPLPEENCRNRRSPAGRATHQSRLDPLRATPPPEAAATQACSARALTRLGASSAARRCNPTKSLEGTLLATASRPGPRRPDRTPRASALFQGRQQQGFDLLEPAVRAAEHRRQGVSGIEGLGHGQRKVAPDPIDAWHQHPSQRIRPQTPAASTKRQSGLTRYTFSQSAPNCCWLASNPRPTRHPRAG